MKRELKERRRFYSRFTKRRYRTIPYEEGTESISYVKLSIIIFQIQNHSL